MPESWTISVGGRVYGPYSLEQMRGIAQEYAAIVMYWWRGWI